jgi:phosphopantothenoylcysteine decarboxylase/phosphopantothenate--cysteine ligase
MAKEPRQPLAGREILLCVTGGIACYKAAYLASRCVQEGAGVSVAMTESATKFVAPLTFQSLTGREVYTSLWQSEQVYEAQHIAVTDRAELIIVAPATANILAKMALGLADDLVSTLALAAGDRPILVAPAMNSRMWAAPAMVANMATLSERGVIQVGPGQGRLACGTVGLGRMAEPDEIFDQVLKILTKR